MAEVVGPAQPGKLARRESFRTQGSLDLGVRSASVLGKVGLGMLHAENLQTLYFVGLMKVHG